jgi:acetylornithine deacetylase/succinyl-diaminopimelate desuccinylase-like protein
VIDQVQQHIENNKASYIERLMELLRIPSISTDPECKKDVHAAGEWVLNALNECGIEARMVSTPGHPAVIGDTGPVDGGGPTVLTYGHFDVQPVGDESLWKTPPFEPTVRDGAIYARGAADDKGQMLTHLFALEAWKKATGKLPIRIKVLIEGEEEIGSPNLESLVRDHKKQLECDYVAISDTAKFSGEIPAITYGTKGLLYKEITMTGPANDLHSGSFGGTVGNPGNVLAKIVASMKDPDERVTIPGFYDDVKPIADEEKKKMAEMPFTDEGYLKMTGSPGLQGEKGFTTLERRWARPTLDVNGIHGGFVGEGASTIIPAKMMAKVSMRLVPDQSSAKISQAFDKYVRDNAPDSVKVSINTFGATDAYICPLDSPGINAAATAVEMGFGTKPFFIREGGSLPILPMFKSLLDAESLMMGFCWPNCNAHGPNEFFHEADLFNGTKSIAHFFDQMSRVS